VVSVLFCGSRPAPETLTEYQKKVDLLKGLIAVDKLVSVFKRFVPGHSNHKATTKGGFKFLNTLKYDYYNATYNNTAGRSADNHSPTCQMREEFRIGE
jgi:hypothetical protein